MGIVLENILKGYNNRIVLNNLNLNVSEGEFHVLLGPTGSGKTTLLSIIAGLIKQDKGSVLIGNRNVDHISPGKRGIGFVFQNYALFSHLTVFENIAYGLRVNKEKEEEIVKKVCFFLQKFHLAEISHKYPHQLSGGQKQKVALIRALAIKPHILLMDEPMSNLDAPTRENIGDELKGIHREMKTTTLYVTHNQSEAVRLGDHISVMNQGRIEQTGTPDDVFHHPSTTFVSRFVGIKNIFKVRVIKILEQYVMVELLDKRSAVPVTFKVKNIRFSKRWERRSHYVSIRRKSV